LRVIALTWRDLANPSAGGAEVLIDRLLSGLRERGHHVTLVSGGPVSEHEYQVVNGGGTYSQYLTAPLICMTRLRQADVIIDVENGLPYFSPLWRRKPSLCLVHHVHTDQWHGHFPATVAPGCRARVRWVMPAVYRNRIFVAVSSSTAAELCAIGVPHRNIRIVESGVDIPSGVPAPKSQDPLYVSLSRLVPHKRIDLLLRSWERAAREVPGRLVIAGDGPELASLQKQAATIPRVEMVGRISEETKDTLLSEAWAIVSTAHHEGWGMSIMEAAAVGTPSLVLDAPGIRDAVVDGVTGVVVRGPEDEISSRLADAWVDYASDAGLRQKLGDAALERAASFSWDKTIDRWEAVLQEVATGKPDARN
jgi:glycosyltransferase involved in cell wall biosynthesis